MDARIKRLQAIVKQLQSKPQAVTVCFMDGSHRTIHSLEAVQLCATDETVVDAFMDDETGTSLLRALIDADKDFSDLPELAGE